MSNAMPRANRRRTRSLVLAGAATACAAIAIAAVGTFQTTQASTGYNPLTPALGFNAFVEDQTLLASTESEGGIATGGNLVLGTYNVNIHDASTFTTPGDSVPSSLVVGGRIAFAQAQAGAVVQVHDYVKVGDLTGTDVLNTDSNNASVNTHVVAAGAGTTDGATDGTADGSDDPSDSDEYSGGRGDHLATTGSGLGAFVIGAASLVTVGAVAMFSARRRRTDEPD
jgi:hypothetical protein